MSRKMVTWEISQWTSTLAEMNKIPHKVANINSELTVLPVFQELEGCRQLGPTLKANIHVPLTTRP